MKKVLLLAVAILGFATAVSAGNVAKVTKAAKPVTTKATRATANIQMTNLVTTVYDEGYETPNYYILLASNDAVTYDNNTGNITNATGSYVLTLDLYNYATDPCELLPGAYLCRNDENGYGPSTYDPDYSSLIYYESDDDSYGWALNDVVYVSKTDDGIYTITTVLTEESSGNSINLSYTGRIPMSNVNEKSYVYPQIKHDIEAELNFGGIAYYQGITDYSRNGVTYFDVFSCPIEDGTMTEDGWNLNMMIAHKRITTRDAYCVIPGEYTNATNFDRDTWYPGREIDYSFGGTVMTFPFGSYIRQRLNGEYTYAYLKEGTFTIVDNGDGTYKGELNGTTTLGYAVHMTWQGEMALNTDNASFSATISNLTDDVDLDFSRIETGRIWHTGLQGGCRTFKVDLGSPAGRDEGINNGGDLLRMEFLAPTNCATVMPGVYTVVLDRWNEYELAGGGKYEPFSLNKGHFDGHGGSDGTRYAHFKEGSYCVEDLLGPAEEGQVTVTTDDYVNYHFDINLFDDAGFKITGVYDGPIEYMYSKEALEGQLNAIDEIGADANAVKVVVEDSYILVLNAGNSPVKLYNTLGGLVLSTTAEKAIATDSLQHGIYVVNVKGKSVKVAL